MTTILLPSNESRFAPVNLNEFTAAATYRQSKVEIESAVRFYQAQMDYYIRLRYDATQHPERHSLEQMRGLLANYDRQIGIASELAEAYSTQLNLTET